MPNTPPTHHDGQPPGGTPDGSALPDSPACPPPATAHDQTRDLSVSHLVERLADGEIRGDEIASIEEWVSSLPDGPRRVAEQKALRAACARVMSVEPLDPDVESRVMHAVHLRLRGESDARRELQAPAGLTPVPDAGSRRLSFWRLSAAAALVLAGFIAARFTDRSNEDRDFSEAMRSASAPGVSAQRVLSTDYYAASVLEAERFLGHTITLPGSADVNPLRYVRGPSDAQPRTVTFVYLVRVPDPVEDGRTLSVAVPLVIQTLNDSDFDPSVVVEHVDGDVHWRIRQVGSLIYHIQSESELALRRVSDLLGWPAPLGKE